MSSLSYQPSKIVNQHINDRDTLANDLARYNAFIFQGIMLNMLNHRLHSTVNVKCLANISNVQTAAVVMMMLHIFRIHAVS